MHYRKDYIRGRLMPSASVSLGGGCGARRCRGAKREFHFDHYVAAGRRAHAAHCLLFLPVQIGQASIIQHRGNLVNFDATLSDSKQYVQELFQLKTSSE